ncbi:DsbC family protein [Pseudomonas aeruginosa]|uniref:DsbC family protein n=1 Tax=Pseudomonas aeruginosa TaxID=287 RepID=UPI003D2BF262
MKKILMAALLSIAASAPLVQAAQPACGTASEYAWLTAALSASAGQASEVTTVTPAGELDLCEIRLNSGTIVYSRPGTQAILLGRLFSVAGTEITDKTQASMDRANLEQLGKIQPNDYITYATAEPAKSHIYVMTDVDCTYCQKLHAEVSKLNAAGIEVRYLPFVRGGRQGSAWNTMSNIWCSTSDRKKPLDEAFAGKKLEKAECGEEILDRYQVFGRDVQLQGTPHILFADGTSQSGSSDDLIDKALKAANRGTPDAPTH